MKMEIGTVKKYKSNIMYIQFVSWINQLQHILMHKIKRRECSNLEPNYKI